jgi:SAM-dependent methyltransferase
VTDSDQKRSVREGYDALASAYEDERTPDEREFELLDDLSSRIGPGGRVLDAGSGPGTPVASALVGDHEAVCLDASRAQLELAAENVPAAGRVEGDLTALPFADGAFDAVCAFNSVIHVPVDEHGDVFAEFARVLSPGGYLLVSLGREAWSGRNDDWLDTGVEMAWSFPDLDTSLAHLDAAGFEVRRRDVADDELGGGSWAFVLARHTR